MQPGDMQDRVVFQEMTAVPDGGGGHTKEWLQLGPPSWAKIEPLSVRDQITAAQNGSETQYRVTIYHRTDLKDHHRIVCDDERILEITGILPRRLSPFVDVMAFLKRP